MIYTDNISLNIKVLSINYSSSLVKVSIIVRYSIAIMGAFGRAFTSGKVLFFKKLLKKSSYNTICLYFSKEVELENNQFFYLLINI